MNDYEKIECYLNDFQKNQNKHTKDLLDETTDLICDFIDKLILENDENNLIYLIEKLLEDCKKTNSILYESIFTYCEDQEWRL